MELQTIRLEKTESIATITLNRPEKMNAYNSIMLDELSSVLEDVALDKDIRAVIITGEGRAFCAGADVQDIGALLSLQNELPERQDILKLLIRSVLAIRQMPKPVVAALNGVAAGGGANLALACDIILASEKARLAENFINIGLVPDGGGTYFLPERIGYQRSAEIFFTGRILSAQEALDMGLYNRVVPAEELMGSVKELAQDLAGRPTRAIAAGKAILNREAIPRLRAYLEDEAGTQRAMVLTQDAKEGISAFTEKRKPDFKGQ
jgi:2-(1,2-epoxy-1,2-dihydrophenyl)acetyl-CoA isomerase